MVAFNPYKLAQDQLEKVAGLLELDQATRDLLSMPLREYNFSIRVRMDEGYMRIFQGFRVQHNDARGLCKGGVRFHPEVSIDTARAQAMWSTWKAAVADLPLGGANGGIICDPHDLSRDEQEQICRGWVRNLTHDVGPYRDAVQPDIMATPMHMLWMLDEYEMTFGEKKSGLSSGKPVRLSGSKGQKESTGYGLAYALREAMYELNISPSETSASIQGFGNVGQHAFELYEKMGGTVICVACWDQNEQKSYAYRKKDGIEFKELRKITNRFGEIDKGRAEERGYDVLEGTEWLEQEVDILIPAAMENQITSENVGKIKDGVKIIAEGADGPTTLEADEVIRQREILLLPDLLANSGGAICSYFEQIQGNLNYFWQKDEVLSKLDVKMTNAFFDVLELAEKKDIYMRDAAYLIGVGRVAQACRDRGWV